MNFNNPVLLAVAGVIVLVVGIVWGAHFFAPDAKLERRRRRNNYRVVSNSRRRSIKLSARTKKQ